MEDSGGNYSPMEDSVLQKFQEKGFFYYTIIKQQNH